MTKILVIEDDPVLKGNVVDILQEESFQAIDASNGIVGLKLAKEHQPDLILCDVRMPHMDGYEVLQTLKQNYYTSSIPFIFITSETSRQFWRKGMELGADDYITKPFTPEELLKAILIRSKKSQLDKHSMIKADRAIESQTIFNFDYNTNLLSRFSLQAKFEDLVKNYLLANIDSLARKQKIKLQIPFLCVSINNFAGITKSLDDNQQATLLKVVAERLLIGTFAKGIIAHLEGGMFAVILPPVEQKKDVVATVNRIHKYLDLHFEPQLNLPQLFLDVSTGISFYADYATNAHIIIEQAKKTAKLAKNHSKNYAFDRPQHQSNNFLSSFYFKKDVLRCFQREDFQVLYQPQFCLKTNQIIGCEATVSMQHPKYGSLLFPQLMATVNDDKMIAHINFWLWKQACKQLKWQREKFKQLKLSVKVAESYFYQDTFNLDLAKLIQKYQLSYGVLELEISELTLLHNKQQALEKLNGLNNLGIKITLDEFASGYTNLEYWQEFPIDKVKLNWQNLQKSNDTKHIQQIISATATVAHSKGIKAIATGIKTHQDLQFFTQYQYDFAQGNYWSKPLTAQRFIQFFDD